MTGSGGKNRPKTAKNGQKRKKSAFYVKKIHLPDNFFELFSDPRLLPHMHLPVQSGCDSVLRRMSRRCKTAEFMEVVEQKASTDLFDVLSVRRAAPTGVVL